MLGAPPERPQDEGERLGQGQLRAPEGHGAVESVANGCLNVSLFFPSGALYPLASFPTWLRAFARMDPEKHAVATPKAILFRGGDLAAAPAGADPAGFGRRRE